MVSSPSTSNQRGFSLIELLIGMVIAVEILLAALTVFDVHNRMARVQLQITDMQQSLRVAQYDMVRATRMAGRGGLPTAFRVEPAGLLSVPWLRGLAIEVRDNVLEATDDQVAIGIEEPVAQPGTDILTVRGCLSGLLFQMDPTNPADFTATSLTVRKDLSNGRSQDLTHLLEPGFSSPILLQSSISRGQYVIAEVVSVDGNADIVTVKITFDSDLSPPNPLIVAPPAGFVPGFACALEEYRYYVRPTFITDAEGGSQLSPRLTRARMIPGTELPHDEDEANLSLDLAEEIFDLQVALGFDTDFDSAGSGAGSFEADVDALGVDDVFYEGEDDDARAKDDWFGNSSLDDPTAAEYLANAGVPRPEAGVRLYYVRISTLGRTARRDAKYVAPDFDPVAGEDFIENHNYDEDPASTFKSPVNRQFRHRLLRTVVDLRNI